MKGIKFRGNLKENLIPFEEGEIVYSIDTNEWGLSIYENGVLEYKWRTHFQPLVSKDNGWYNPHSDYGEFGTIFHNSSNDKYYIKNDVWEEIIISPSRTWVTQEFHTYPTTAVANDGSTDIPYSSGDNRILAVRRLSELYGFLKVDGSNRMYYDETRKYSDGDSFLSFDNSVVKWVVPLKPSDGFYGENGVLKYQIPQAHIRYYTNSSLTFNTGVKTPVNGVIDIIGNDSVYPITSFNTANPVDTGDTVDSNEMLYSVFQQGSPITKIEVLKYGNRTSWFKIAYYCDNMVEFVVSATDQSKVTDFAYAWFGCSSLTSFPSLDISNGTDFTNSWKYCSSLPHCPVGNEVTIPAGAITTNMCLGI